MNKPYSDTPRQNFGDHLSAALPSAEEILVKARSFKTAPTDFDKRLNELNLSYTQIELIKQAVEELVIGEDRRYEKLEICPVCSSPQYSCACAYAEEREHVRQRGALWGPDIP